MNTHGRNGTMKFSEKNDNDKEWTEEYKDNSVEALRYWVNSTTALFGANYSCNILLLAMKALLEEVGTPAQADRIEEVITSELVKSFDYIRAKATSAEEAEEKSTEWADILPNNKIKH